MTIQEGILFGLGNLLLDITALVETSFLEKFSLKPNDSVQAEDKHLAVYDEINPVEYGAGGSALNTLRVAQWVLQSPKATTLMGAVGKDEYADKLVSTASNDGVNVLVQQVDSCPTGRCAVLVNGENRSLVTQLGAAKKFTVDHLKRPENFEHLKKAKYFYISGYFLTVCMATVMEVARYAFSNRRPLLFNLNSVWVPKLCKSEVNQLMDYVDILFGNETEVTAYALENNYDCDDLVSISRKICSLPKLNNIISRTVVVTRGRNNVLVVQIGNAHDEDFVKEFPVHFVSSDKMLDSNGAGDAFLGGFLAQYIQGKNIDSCINCGIWTASEVLQQRGCSFPKEKLYTERHLIS